jgi:hypothetical protein
MCIQVAFGSFRTVCVHVCVTDLYRPPEKKRRVHPNSIANLSRGKKTCPGCGAQHARNRRLPCDKTIAGGEVCGHDFAGSEPSETYEMGPALNCTTTFDSASRSFGRVVTQVGTDDDGIAECLRKCVCCVSCGISSLVQDRPE